MVTHGLGFLVLFLFLSVSSEVGHPEEFGVYLASVGNKTKRKLLNYLLLAFRPSCLVLFKSASDDSTTSEIRGSTTGSNSCKQI